MMTDKTRCGVIFCPKQGVFYRDKKREKIEQLLAANNVEYDWVEAESSERVRHLVKMFVNNDYRTIVLVGGDTALNDFVNTLMLFEASVIEQIAFSVIPYGVMNDFAHFWGAREGNEDKIIKALKQRRIRRIDVGKVTYVNKKGERCRRYFLNCVNIGFISSIMNLRRKTRALLCSRTLSFFASFVLMIFQRMDYKMKLKINNEQIVRKVMTVCVGNATGYGQTPNAVPYNGALDVSVVSHPEITQLFEGIYLFLRGKFLNHRSVHPYRTDRVEVFETGNAPVSVDGRLMNSPLGSFSIIVEQEKLQFIIPD